MLALLGSWFVSWRSECAREKKKRVFAIKMLFISLSHNQRSMLDQKQAIQNRINQGFDSMFRTQWPIDNLDLHDYRKSFYFLADESDAGFLKSLYHINFLLKCILRLKKTIAFMFGKITPETRNKFKENASILDEKSVLYKASIPYQMYIKYIDFYLSETSNLMKHLKKYAKDENIVLPEIFPPEG